jgi:diaminobutyrate-2-oxoglutarate transaminase
MNPRESNINYYSRKFPVIFKQATNATLIDTENRAYIDFFMGAGALNYGHNHPQLKHAVIEHLSNNTIIHTLDMQTEMRQAFIARFITTILNPAGLDHLLAFPSPSGTNAVELALKFARSYTKRQGIFSFTNAYHGVSLGALAGTGNRRKRAFSGAPLPNVTFFPFDNYLSQDFDSIDYMEKMLADSSSGADLPAAVILETIQAEGGINIASESWLRRLAKLCRAYDILIIIDDIQVGCGRTNQFFSFSKEIIEPDIICLSKSLSGLGLPLSLVLIKPFLDIAKPGDHNGTFRSNNLALACAHETMSFWESDHFQSEILQSSQYLFDSLQQYATTFSPLTKLRGRGMIFGLEYPGELAMKISNTAFNQGLLVETCGSSDQTIKIMPPINVSSAVIDEAIEKLATATEIVISQTKLIQ